MSTATKRTISLDPHRLALKGKRSKEIGIPDGLTVLDEPQEKAPQGFGCFRVMTPKDGDKRVIWDNTSFEQIREAKEMFDELVEEGLYPYRVGVDGQASADVMDEFDPHAEEIIFMPIAAVAGG